jgi:hypothetical protein
MKTTIYSLDKKYYYVKEFVCGFCNWVGVEKLTKLPEDFIQNPKTFGNLLRGFVQYDNSYFRELLQFNFWKVKSGEQIQVQDDDELVKDYYGCGRHK